MTLPGFALQSVYMDVGWGIVLAALLATMARSAPESGAQWRARAPAAWIAAAAFVAMWLPGHWSPSFWLGMAFQYPSLMLVALCTAQLARLLAPSRAWQDRPLLPALPAATLALLGIALYAGTFVWLPYDVYAFGYSGFSAATIATLLFVAWCRGAARNGIACACVAAAALAHAVTRLPTGNAWDAILDPLLFCWAVAASGGALLARLRLNQPLPAARASR